MLGAVPTEAPEKKATPRPARCSPVMTTTVELFDRVAEIECATSLDDRRRPATDFHAVGVGLAHWAAIYGPFASWRILRVACRALLTSVWRPRACRPNPGAWMRAWLWVVKSRSR